MAIQDKNGFLKGKKGDSIYRLLNNKPTVSQRPVQVHQVENSKITAFEFGLCSNTARCIRLAFSIFHIGLDGGFCNRLNTAIRSAFMSGKNTRIGTRDLHDADLRPLFQLQFNQYAPMGKVLKVRPTVWLEDNDTVSFSLPSFSVIKDLIFPKLNLHVNCTLRITLCAFHFRKEFYQNMGFQDIELSGSVFPGVQWNFDECVPAGSILLVCMSLHYFIVDLAIGKKDLGLKEFSPAEIVGAFSIPSDKEEKLESSSNWDDNQLPLEGYKGNMLLRDSDPSWAY
ncbi:hypothetical protein [Arcticibacter eurypsychrophilus]|uniref:hypothetical protein n=1 Tax=Arcticibacter eurypsychrophilus TaxID=1434752 RepID=UPI00084CEFEE|nr:hypothetical protein [Arcticibacter eurypsychrophilus]